MIVESIGEGGSNEWEKPEFSVASLECSESKESWKCSDKTEHSHVESVEWIKFIGRFNYKIVGAHLAACFLDLSVADASEDLCHLHGLKFIVSVSKLDGVLPLSKNIIFKSFSSLDEPSDSDLELVVELSSLSIPFIKEWILVEDGTLLFDHDSW